METARSQRMTMALPNGQVVTVLVTPDILARATRVRRALEANEAPEPEDLAILVAYLAEDT